MVQPSNQVGLHVHSEGSYLDGYSKVTDIAKRAAEIGQQAIALTDHGECNQHLAFQKACRAQGIAPILGIEGYWHEDIAAAREKKKYPKDLSHICLLAQNQKGLSNLWALSSMAYTPKYFYYRPIADPALMREYSEGLLGSDGCLMTQFAAHVWAGDEAAARQYYATLQGIFGDRFYVELHTWQYMHPRDDDGIEFFGETITTTQANQLMTDVNQAKLRLANEMGVPVVIVNDAHHAWEQDWEKRDLVWQMNTSKGDQTPAGQKADHIMDDAELYYWMGRHGIGRSVVEEAIRNSWEIAQGCTAEIVPMLEMPTFTDTEREDMIAFIAAVEKGFKRKVVDGGLDAERYWKRMESEVELICEKRFAGYFLTVADYVRAAKTGTWQRYVGDGGKDPMITGPGRGSAGGALVSWLMDITALDPIRYDLLFERFMTPSRKGFPDIDVDFPQSRLRGMAQYLGARHGHDHVCALGTVGRNGPKGMLRDLCKVHDVPWKDRKAMSEIIEKGVEIVAASREAADESGDDLSWDEVLAEKGGDLQQYAKRYPKLFEQLGEMVGVARNSSKHASGWLINNQPLLGLIPLRTRNHGKADEVVTTQFEMGEIEELGGVKFDLLGLRHLDTLDHAAKLVTSRHGVDLDLEAFDPDVEEPEIWEPIDAGHTVGLFQVETPGSTRVAVDLKPRSVRDLAALISIVRPGVKDAGLTDRFLKRRSGDEDVVYDHPLMRPIVENTYGILVYQEQMIRAARDLAGFTAEEADQLRKVTAKKLADQIGPFETKFRDGCLANPEFMDALDGDQAAARKAIGKIWTSINASSNYAFNLSHAVGYSHISWWEAWLGHHYPNEMLVALMATDSDNINRYVREARRRGVSILPPDINLSDEKFSISDQGIRYGLDTLVGVGRSAANDIRRRRPYASAQDFFDRTRANKTQVINLIKLGALDSLGYDPDLDGGEAALCRSRLLQQFYDHCVWKGVADSVRYKKRAPEDRAAHLAAWFDKHRADPSFETDFPTFDFADPEVVHKIEMELVGTYITVDPMGPYLSALDDVAIKDPAEVTAKGIGETFVIGGQITKVKKHTIAKGRYAGQEMAFLNIEYNELDFDITVFSDTWNTTKNLLIEGSPVACTVIRDERGCHLVSMERLDLLWKAAT